MTTMECALCGADAGTGYVCRGCERRCGREVLQLVDLLDGDVLATVARQDQHGAGGGRGQVGLPVNLAASARGAAAAAVVCSASAQVALARGAVVPGRPGPPAGPLCRHGLGCLHRSCWEIRFRYVPPPVVVAGRWLVGQLGWVRHRPWAGDLLRELQAAAGSVFRLVDSPPARVYRGPCEAELPGGVVCGGELYARPGADWVRCPRCRAEHEVEARRRWLDRLVRDRAYAPADIAGAYREIRAGTIRQWASRGRLVAHGHDERGRPLYPLGEVLDLAAADAGRRATAQATRQRQATARAERERRAGERPGGEVAASDTVTAIRR